MKLYSAVIWDGTRIIFIKEQEYAAKADFIRDLRANHMICNPLGWKLTEKLKPGRARAGTSTTGGII